MELIPWGELQQQGSNCISKMALLDWLWVTLVYWDNEEKEREEGNLLGIGRNIGWNFDCKLGF